MVEGAGIAGAEFESGAAGTTEGAGAALVSGAAGTAGVAVLSGVDELGGGTGPMRVFVSGTAPAEGAGAVAAEGLAAEVACADAVRMR